jgi:Flp pilus assembly protein CpaB
VIVATLFVALWAPIFLLAGPAGLLVDRLEPRRVLVVAAVAQAVFAGVLAFTSGSAPRVSRVGAVPERARDGIVFLAGALPFVAGLAGLALHSRRRRADEAPATVTV